MTSSSPGPSHRGASEPPSTRGGGQRASPASGLVPYSLSRFSSERKMLMIETKIPVASQTASFWVPCLRR